MRSGRGIIALVLVVAIAAGIGGLFAGRYIESPEEAAASAAPPEASLITVPVELRELSSSVITRGDVVFSDSSEITPVVTGAGVVTRVAPAAGDVLDEGDVLVDIEGRPLFAMQGDLPMFRSLGPGMSGDDVLQLEEALLRMGYVPGIADGIYDVNTEEALRSFYKDAGYDVTDLSPDEKATLKQFQDSVDGAQTDLDQARKSLTDAQAPLPQSVQLEESQTQTQMESAVADAKSARDANNLAAANQVTNRQAEVNAAASAKTTALERLEQALAGTDPDTGGPVDPGRVAELQGMYDDARANLDLLNEQLTAERAAIATTKTEGEAMVKAQQDALALHNARMVETRAERADVTSLQTAVNEAVERLSAAQAAFDDYNSEVGVTVPQPEIVFLDGLPRRVQRVLVERGDVVSGSIMVVSGTEVKVQGSIAAVDRTLVNVGDTAIVSDTGLGIEFEAEITFLADSTGGTVGADRYAMTLVPKVDDVPEGATDNNLKVTIPFSTSGGEVLAVPLAALSAAGDGSVRVEVETSAGETRFVEVQTGLRTGDFVEVTPIDGELAEGDQVVVGQS